VVWSTTAFQDIETVLISEKFPYGCASRICQKYIRLSLEDQTLTDRALKLAEIGKPKSNWELQGVLGLAVFILGFLAGK